MPDIKLSEIMTNLKPVDQYKVHFAKKSNGRLF